MFAVLIGVTTALGVQMVGALMWIAYGVLQHALPVVVANVLVFAAAGWTAQRSSAG